MRKITLLLAAVAFSIIGAYAQQAKYVFYFIGDGMGVNQVQGTELYRGELEGKIGITPILFTQFPYATVATTFSATNGVTDSAAAGTALATGNKTKKWCHRCTEGSGNTGEQHRCLGQKCRLPRGSSYQRQCRPCNTCSLLCPCRKQKQLL